MAATQVITPALWRIATSVDVGAIHTIRIADLGACRSERLLGAHSRRSSAMPRMAALFRFGSVLLTMAGLGLSWRRHVWQHWDQPLARPQVCRNPYNNIALFVACIDVRVGCNHI